MTLLDLFRKKLRPTRHGTERPAAKGVTVTVRPANADGVPVVELTRLTRIALADMTMVADYRIERHFGSVSHHVRLTNDGAIRLADAETGELLELSTEKVKVVVDADGTVTFGLAEEKP